MAVLIPWEAGPPSRVAWSRLPLLGLGGWKAYGCLPDLTAQEILWAGKPQPGLPSRTASAAEVPISPSRDANGEIHEVWTNTYMGFGISRSELML